MDNKEMLEEIAELAREVNKLSTELLEKVMEYRRSETEQMQAAQMKAETDAIINSEGVSQATAVRRKWFGSGNNELRTIKAPKGYEDCHHCGDVAIGIESLYGEPIALCKNCMAEVNEWREQEIAQNKYINEMFAKGKTTQKD